MLTRVKPTIGTAPTLILNSLNPGMRSRSQFIFTKALPSVISHSPACAR